MWSITLRRMAGSGPASLIAAERAFPDHPEHQRADEDALATHRAHVDVIVFVTVGDMVLDDLAGLVLEREKADASDVPWREFMTRLDQAASRGQNDARLGPARELDLRLREARNRLVAHRDRRQALVFAWQPDNTIQVTLVDPNAVAEALAILAEVNSRLRLPLRGTHDYHAMLDWVIAFARELGAHDRKQVKDALRLAGFETYSPERIVEEVLALATSVLGTNVGRDA